MRTISFSKTKQEEFYKVLRKRVNEHFKSEGISRHGNYNMVLKTVFMVSLYIVPYIFMLTIVPNSWAVLFLWILMGFGMSGIGLSIMHDANHGAYSKKAAVNKLFGWSMLVVGGSDVNWRIQHNVLHHTYTNVHEMDDDIDAPSMILRFSPHDPIKKIHRFQFIYAWIMYSFMTLSWLFMKDFTDAVKYNKQGLMKTQKINITRHWFNLILSKLIYAFLLIGLPILITPISWYITLIGFFIMQFTAGLVLSMIFQPAHCIPTSEFPLPDKEGNIEQNWAIHQLKTTANFAPASRIFTWLVGGLNYQIEHHLFPNICHIHYRKISKIVRETAMEYNLPYYSNKTFIKALSEHAKMLYKLGRAS